MTKHYSGDWQGTNQCIRNDLTNQSPVNRGEWQSLDISQSPLHETHELLNVTIECQVPMNVLTLQWLTKPDLPWAEEHFAERVSGIPHNPPPSHVNWPGHKGKSSDHLDAVTGKFSHTYPERIWPKTAWCGELIPEEEQDPLLGIRYQYGDLNDVVSLLQKNLLTRQAYLPIWFPEDTGAQEGQRVPCTLGYHFQWNSVTNVLDMTYLIRSCDYVRHFHNDVYLAARLLQWMALELTTDDRLILPGTLIIHCMNLHMMVGDRNSQR